MKRLDFATYTKSDKRSNKIGDKMKMKNQYENEILSKLKALEEEYDLLVYYNNLPSDISANAAEWVKKRTQGKNKTDDRK